MKNRSIEKFLGLHNLGISQRSIAKTCRCSRDRVSMIIRQIPGMSDDTLDGMTDDELQHLIFGSTKANEFEMPNYTTIHKELGKTGVTLKMMWDEYCEQCRIEQKRAFRYIQFCFHYRNFIEKNRATMTFSHHPAERVEVDWAGEHLELKDNVTGKSIPVYLFVASLPYS